MAKVDQVSEMRRKLIEDEDYPATFEGEGFYLISGGKVSASAHMESHMGDRSYNTIVLYSEGLFTPVKIPNYRF